MAAATPSSMVNRRNTKAYRDLVGRTAQRMPSFAPLKRFLTMSEHDNTASKIDIIEFEENGEIELYNNIPFDALQTRLTLNADRPQLLLIENITPGVITFLGDNWGIPPDFFLAHLENSNWYSLQNIPQNLPALRSVYQNYVRFQFVGPREFEVEPAATTVHQDLELADHFIGETNPKIPDSATIGRIAGGFNPLEHPPGDDDDELFHYYADEDAVRDQCNPPLMKSASAPPQGTNTLSVPLHHALGRLMSREERGSTRHSRNTASRNNQKHDPRSAKKANPVGFIRNSVTAWFDKLKSGEETMDSAQDSPNCDNKKTQIPESQCFSNCHDKQRREAMSKGKAAVDGARDSSNDHNQDQGQETLGGENSSKDQSKMPKKRWNRGIILFDPPFKAKGHYFTKRNSIYRSFIHRRDPPDYDDDDFDDRTSYKDSFIKCLRHNSDLKKLERIPRPFEILQDLCRIIASEWIVLNTYFERELNNVERHFEKWGVKCEPELLQKMLRQLMMARRRIAKYDMLVADQLELCPRSWKHAARNMPVPHVEPPPVVLDFYQVQDHFDYNKARIALAIQVITSFMAIHQSQQVYEQTKLSQQRTDQSYEQTKLSESRNSKLTLLIGVTSVFFPFTAVAAIMTIPNEEGGPGLGPGGRHFGTFWASSIPPAVIFFCLFLVTWKFPSPIKAIQRIISAARTKKTKDTEKKTTEPIPVVINDVLEDSHGVNFVNDISTGVGTSLAGSHKSSGEHSRSKSGDEHGIELSDRIGQSELSPV